MNRRKMCAVMLGLCLSMFSFSTVAADPATTREQQQLRDQDIYGYQLMTPEERNEYRTKMRAAKTAEEREQIRREHHEQMVARAKERGVTLPETPPARGYGRGPGMGGPGMGGPGPGRGPRY
jgi:hypothetical protein